MRNDGELDEAVVSSAPALGWSSARAARARLPYTIAGGMPLVPGLSGGWWRVLLDCTRLQRVARAARVLRKSAGVEVPSSHYGTRVCGGMPIRSDLRGMTGLAGAAPVGVGSAVPLRKAGHALLERCVAPVAALALVEARPGPVFEMRL